MTTSTSTGPAPPATAAPALHADHHPTGHTPVRRLRLALAALALVVLVAASFALGHAQGSTGPTDDSLTPPAANTASGDAPTSGDELCRIGRPC